MSLNKNHINKKAAAGAALVALSGFVPQVADNQAQAATATITVTASLVTGITLAAGDDLQFATAAATQGTGSLVMAPAGTVTYNKATAAISGGTVKNGTLAFTAANATGKISVTVAGIGAVTGLAATTGGAGPTGSLTLDSVVLDKMNAGNETVTVGVGSTGKIATVTLTAGAATTTIDVGISLSWGATLPVGKFTQALTFTMAY